MNNEIKQMLKVLRTQSDQSVKSLVQYMSLVHPEDDSMEGMLLTKLTNELLNIKHMCEVIDVVISRKKDSDEKDDVSEPIERKERMMTDEQRNKITDLLKKTRTKGEEIQKQFKKTSKDFTYADAVAAIKYLESKGEIL